MKNNQFKRMISQLAFVLILVLTACGPSAQAPVASVFAPSCPDIWIGAVIAGSETVGGAEQKLGYEMALSEINREGGIQTCKVQLYYPPDGETLNPDSAQIAMLELVQKDVVAIVGATSPNATKRAAALANYFKTPFLISSDTGDDTILTGTQWLFRIPPQNKAYASTAFDMAKANMSGTANVAVLFEKSEYGESAAVAAGTAVINHGLNLVSYQRFDPVQADYTAIFSSLTGGATDIVYLISTNPLQARDMLRALRNPQSVVKNLAFASLGLTLIIGNGSGFTNSQFLYDNAGALSTELSNLVITVPWQADLPWKGNDQFANNLKTYQQSSSGSKIQAVPQVVESYTALKVLAQALNQVALEDKNWRSKFSGRTGLPAYRETLAKKLRSPQAGSWETLLGPLSFDAEGQNTQTEIPLVQAIDGKLITVYPDKYKTHDLVFVKGW